MAKLTGCGEPTDTKLSSQCRQVFRARNLIAAD